MLNYEYTALSYRYFVHSLTDIYVSNDYNSAYSRACELAATSDFILFYDRIKGICIHHIDELTAYNENMKV